MDAREEAILQLCNTTEIAFPVYNEYTSAAFALTSISFAVCLGWLVVLIWLRNTPVMQISQWNLLLGYIASFAAMNCSAIVRTANSYPPFSNKSCVAWEWLAHVPLSFILGVLTVKEYRTWQLRLKTRRLQKAELPVPHIIAYLGTTFVISCIILSAWTATKPPTVDPCLNFQCAINSPAAFWTIIAFQALQLLLLLTIAYQDYNEGKVGGEGLGIIINAVSMIVYFAMVLAATVSNPGSRKADNELNRSNAVEAFVNALTLFLATAVSLGSIFFPKLRYRHTERDEILKLFLEKNKSGSAKRFSSSSGKSPESQERPPSGNQPSAEPSSTAPAADANVLAQV